MNKEGVDEAFEDSGWWELCPWAFNFSLLKHDYNPGPRDSIDFFMIILSIISVNYQDLLKCEIWPSSPSTCYF